MSSYLEATYIEVTPIKCKSEISWQSVWFLRKRSKRATEAKKVWSSHLKFVSTSIIQSTIRARRAGVILWRSKQFVVKYFSSSSRLYS